MLTQRAGLLGFVAFCFYLIAVVNTLPGFYYILMWLALGLLAASLGIAFLSLTGLNFAWKLARARGFAAAPKGEAGRELAAPVVEASVSNKGSLNKTGIIVDLLLRDQLRETDLWMGFLLEAIPAGQSLEVALPLRDLPRGFYSLQRAQLVGSDVLGLFRARRRVELEGNAEIVIGPALLPSVSVLALERGGRERRGSQKRARPGAGDELHGTRPYVTGDDLRHIHWKTTARTGELVMREWEQVGHGATLVIWDGARAGESGQGALNSTECGLVLVASLLSSFAADGLPCALALLGKEARFIARARAQAERRGGADSLASEVTEALAGARAERDEPLSSALHRVWNGTQGHDGAIVVSASLAPDVVALARELIARNLDVRVILLDGAALEVLGASPRSGARCAARPNADGASTDAAATQRQAEQLRRAGAQVTLLAPQTAGETWPALQSALARALGGGREAATDGARAETMV